MEGDLIEGLTEERRKEIEGLADLFAPEARQREERLESARRSREWRERQKAIYASLYASPPPVRAEKVREKPKKARKEPKERVRCVGEAGGRQRRERHARDEVPVIKEIPPELRKVLQRFETPEGPSDALAARRRRIRGTRLQTDDDILLAAASISPRGIASGEDDVQSYDPAQNGCMPSEAFYGGRGALIGWMEAADDSEPDEDE